MTLSNYPYEVYKERFNTTHLQAGRYRMSCYSIRPYKVKVYDSKNVQIGYDDGKGKVSLVIKTKVYNNFFRQSRSEYVHINGTIDYTTGLIEFDRIIEKLPYTEFILEYMINPLEEKHYNRLKKQELKRTLKELMN